MIRWSRRQPALAAASALAGIALLATVVVSLVFAANKNADAHHLNQLNANLVDREKETATALEEKRAELDARQKAEQARIAEEKQRRRFNRMSTILALDRGVNFCEQGDVRHGLMWLVRALEIEPDDAPDLEFAIRFNLAAWRPSLGELLGRLDHPGTVHAAQLAPGARALVTVSLTGEGHFWNLSSTQPQPLPLGFVSPDRPVPFSPDGKAFLHIANERLQLRDGESGKSLGPPWVLQKSDGSVRAIAVHSDGRTVLIGASTKAWLWDGVTGKQIGTDLLHQKSPGQVAAVAFSADGKVALTVTNIGSDNNVRVGRWDSASGQSLGAPSVLPSTNQQDVLLSDDGKLLFAQAAGRSATLWDLESGKTRTLPVANYGSLRFSPVDNSLVAVTQTGQLQIHDQNGQRTLQLPDGGHNFDFSQDNRHLLITSGNRKKGTLYERKTMGFVGTLPYDQVLAHQFLPDGRLLVVQRTNSGVLLWDQGKVEGSVFPFASETSPAKVTSPSGKFQVRPVLTNARLWNAVTRNFMGEAFSFASGMFDKQEKRFLANGIDGATRVFDTTTGELVGKAIRQGNGTAGELSSDGKRVFTRSALGPAGSVQFWNAETMTPIGAEIRFPTTIVHFGLSPDGNLFFVNLGHEIRLGDASTREFIGPAIRLTGHTFTAVLFSPNSEMLITGAADAKQGNGRLDRWQARTGEVIGQPIVCRFSVRALTSNPASNLVLASCFDRPGPEGEARLFQLPTLAPTGMAIPISTHALLLAEGKIVAGLDAKGVRLYHVATGTLLGPVIPKVYTAAGNAGADPWTLSYWEHDAGLRIVRLPQPMSGSAEAIAKQMQTVTGMELDLDGNPRERPVAWRSKN